jgi:CheY-like chemotaxis protein
MMEVTATDERWPVIREIPPLNVNTLSPAVQATIFRLYRHTASCHCIQRRGSPLILSLRIKSDAMVEVATIGNEGLVGLPAAFGIDRGLTTALGQVADRIKGIEAGADDFLTKPIDEVWSVLGGSDAIGNGGTPDSRPPGGFTIEVISSGPVTGVEAPNMLEYRWMHEGRPAGLVRWELSNGTGHGARLILTQTGPSNLEVEQSTAMNAWKERIARLARHLAGLADD